MVGTNWRYAYWSGVVLAMGCGSSSATHAPKPLPQAPPVATPPVAREPAPPPAAIPYQLPAATPLPKTRRVCSVVAPTGAPAKKRSLKAMHYDFSGIDLLPTPGGARLSKRHPPSLARPIAAIRYVVHRRGFHINRCYRWVRFGARTPRNISARLGVSFSIDPFGDVSGVVVRPRKRGSKHHDRLAACVAEAFRAMHFQGTTGRITRVNGDVVLRPSKLGAPKTPVKRPPPPAITATNRPQDCLALPTNLPTDTINDVLLVRADDWDYGHDLWERQRAAKKRGARIPVVRMHCPSVSFSPPKRHIYQGVVSNEGAYRDCYIKALAKKPNLRGTVESLFTVLPTGGIANLTVRGVDPDLARCIADAMRPLRFRQYDNRVVNVRFPFALRPRPATDEPLPAPRAQRAQALLKRGDAKGALAEYAELIRGSGGGPDECVGRLGVLRAFVRRAPWIADPQVMAAASDFAAYAAKHKPTAATAKCIDQGAQLVARVAAFPAQEKGWRRQSTAARFNGMAESAKRIDALLRVWPTHPEAAALHLIAATGWRHMDEFSRAERSFRSAAKLPLTGRQAANLLWGYRKAFTAERSIKEVTRFGGGCGYP